jgi:hypothetical protein
MHDGRMGGKVDLKLFERDRSIGSIIAHADCTAFEFFLLIRESMGL